MSENNIENYFTMLNSIEENLLDMETEQAEQLLDDIFKIKPVRLKWYLVKAQLMLKKQEDIQKIIDFLSDKCEPWYEYESVEEYFVLMSTLQELKEDVLESKRYSYQLYKLKESMGEGVDAGWMNQESDLRNILMETNDFTQLQGDQIEALANEYFVSGNTYLYMLWITLADKLYGNMFVRKNVLESHNAEYYYERLTSDKEEYFVVMITSKQDEADCILAARALEALGKKVCLIGEPILCQDKEMFDKIYESPLVKMQQRKGIDYWEAYCADGDIDNRGRLLQCISEKYANDGLLTVLGSGLLIENLAANKNNIPKFERLTPTVADYLEENIAVARYGDYLSYVANIYRSTYECVKEELYKVPTCRFSIIIPCRNAGDTLYYTLKTCLNQTYQGSYEIVVSDNSDMMWGEQTPTYEICQRLKDDRIKYYRTPRNLSLMKNFEFAYLKANGEFLISMGADDGILPWALEELNRVLSISPDNPVWLWHEVFYKWADVEEGVMNGFGKSSLRTTYRYDKGSPNVYSYSSKDIFEEAIQDYTYVYFLPQVYHNSGIYRYYLADLYEKTGVLWAGISQDICMAVTIGNIQEQLMFIKNPLTITGISNASIGANCRVGNTAVLENVMRQTFVQGWRVPTLTERLLPPMGGEMGGLYACILYAYAIGVISDEVIHKFDWKMMYTRMIIEMNKEDTVYDKKIHKLRYAISLHGPMMLKWFAETFYHAIMEPRIIKHEEQDTTEEEANVEIEGTKIQVAEDMISDVYKAALFLDDYWNM